MRVPFVTWLQRWLKNYRRNAAVRGVPWRLTKEEFRRLVHQPCHYCGQPPMRQTPIINGERRVTKEKLNGIDRLDSTKGYETANVVPCCKTCNWAKQALSEVDFIAHIEKILKHWRPKNG